jgi:hypothetical protein
LIPPTPLLASSNGVAIMDADLGLDAPFGEPAPFGDPGQEVLPPPKKGDTRIPNRVLDHLAFGDLNSYAVHVFLLLHRRHRHPGLDKDGNRWQGNNGRISLSRVEIAKICGIDRRTSTKALQALVDGNFITEVTPAKFNGQKWSAPEWRINHIECAVTRKAGTFAFRRCKPAASRKNPA